MPSTEEEDKHNDSFDLMMKEIGVETNEGLSNAFKQIVIRRKVMVTTMTTLMMKVAMTMTLLPTPPFLAPD